MNDATDRVQRRFRRRLWIVLALVAIATMRFGCLYMWPRVRDMFEARLEELEEPQHDEPETTPDDEEPGE